MAMKRWLFFTAITAVLAGTALADQCNSKLNCSDCYTTKDCVFCGAKEMNSTLSRCVSQYNIPVKWESQCPPEDRYKAVSKNTTTDNTETGGRKIRLTPSKITVDIGKGQSHNITVNIEVLDIPQLELYILMDLSRTMLDDKGNLEKNLQELIAELQGRTTEQPKIGFGAFVEKPIRPYITLVDNSVENSACNDIKCDEAWGFRHYTKLTVTSDDVKAAIEHAPVALNVDPLEGGFDGIMQAIVCKEVIGWTEGTEKMLVYLSDSAPHMAGDGKLAGISRPNDMKCHMESEEGSGKNYTHVYSYSTIMDYPSVGQIAQKAEEEGINVIFFAVEKVIPLYKRISHNIKSSSYATITKDSEFIVEGITKEYEKIRQKLSLIDDANPGGSLSLRYFSKCKETELKERSECENLKKGDEVEFIIEVTMTSCDTYQDEKTQLINIKSFTDKKNPLELTINPLCKCDCEDTRHSDYDPLSSECSYQGNMMCGVCECLESFGGKKCDCDKTDLDAGGAGCRQGNSTVECNERGDCECNECVCLEGYYGDNCECDDNICKLGKEGKLCSEHGDCECGVCNCHNDWTGEACDCSTQTDNCINPASDKTCSFNGECECNKCKCNNTGYSYTGVWCQTCIDCPKRCSELGPCVLCQHPSQGENEAQCEEQCSQFLLQFTFMDQLFEPSDDEVLCSVFDSDDCRISFIYGPGDDGILHLKVQKSKECPKPPPILAIVLGIVGAIVFLGLIALLAWKCYANYQDRKAYENFLMEQANAKWSDNANPLYKSPQTTVMNPVFGLKQD